METKLTFAEIYDDFRPRIIQYLSRMVGPGDAEDLAQEVFTKVNMSLKDFRGESQLSTWIYRIATNCAYDRMRASDFKQPAAIQLNDELLESKDCGDTAELATDDKVIRKEMNDCIRSYVHKLSNDYRTVIILKEIEGLKSKEIAEILGVSLEAVKIRLHRARAKLQQELKNNCDFSHDKNNDFVCDPKREQI